jgi:glycosyltransferase involved in cell wall biosynthesis
MPAATDSRPAAPALSIVMPTFNNESVLRRAVEGWEHFGGDRVELIVIEDGCRDGTAEYLERVAATAWGSRHLRWVHEEDAHELRCTNRGIALARAPLIAAWQDDMFLQVDWFVPELLALFDAYRDLGMLALSRGLNCRPCPDPLERWEDLVDPRRLESTIGPAPWNWLRLQEVDAVIRPWVVRRACVERVGVLDEAFRPTEWDESDLAFRIREAGWRVATFGYERAGAYRHLGSTTIGTPSEKYKAGVLRNGRLFHQRWDATIQRTHARRRRTWLRKATPSGWVAAAAGAVSRVGGRLSPLFGKKGGYPLSRGPA